ncbi:MAG: peptidyl-tRNA hydrolase [Candidatus Aenigmarchaeota archaeon]|nr:peptidyl-tRNA hydrolase [Candidatus Aenigmarchaeota archaeon]
MKQVILIRKDLKMGKGKIAAQSAHASLQAYKAASATARTAWEEEGSKKVVVAVASEAELIDHYRKARSQGLPCALIRDAGLTQTAPGTATAVGIGPCPDQEADRLTGKLKLL